MERLPAESRKLIEDLEKKNKLDTYITVCLKLSLTNKNVKQIGTSH